MLACADSAATNTAIAEAMGLSLMTVSKWRRRFAQHGVAGLDDAPRSGAPRTVLDEQVEAVITTTLETVPENATHWSTRTLAAHLGLSQTTISRIWRAFALAPHRTEGFKLSTDPYFVNKVRNIVGLYLHPPERASARTSALHADVSLLDQLSGMLVLGSHGTKAQARAVPIDPHPGERHPCLRGYQ